jgi:hypothetical protein
VMEQKMMRGIRDRAHQTRRRQVTRVHCAPRIRAADGRISGPVS